MRVKGNAPYHDVCTLIFKHGTNVSEDVLQLTLIEPLYTVQQYHQSHQAVVLVRHCFQNLYASAITD